MKGKLTIGLVLAGEDNDFSIPVLDYDNKKGIRNVRRLMDQFKLGDALQVKSKRGYHYVFPYDNGRTWDEVVEIINASKCDEDYKDFSEAGFKVLRVGMKHKNSYLRIVGMIKSPYNGQGDKALGTFLLNMYKHSLKHLGNWGLNIKEK